MPQIAGHQSTTLLEPGDVQSSTSRLIASYNAQLKPVSDQPQCDLEGWQRLAQLFKPFLGDMPQRSPSFVSFSCFLGCARWVQQATWPPLRIRSCLGHCDASLQEQ